MQPMRFLIISILSLVLFNAPATAEISLAPPALEEATLENGLKIVVIPDRRAPVVTHMVWYKAGAADEPSGKSGIAHFLEHLMFKGTKNVPAGVFSAKVAEIGGQENAFTSFDFTAYYQKVSPEALEMVMGFEADRMENLVLTDEVIEPEKKVVLEERRSRVDTQPGSILSETVEATLFKHHPYGTPIIGWKNEILGLTKEDAIAFYNKYYSPNNAILVVAGDVAPQEVIRLAQKTYGKVKRRTHDIVRKRVQEPEPVAARTVEYSDPRVTRPSFGRRYLTPSYQQADGLEAESLELLADILGGSSTSRFYKKLVLELEIATAAGAWYQGAALDMTKFAIYGSPRGDTDIKAVETELDNVISDVLENGVTQEELDRAKNNILKSVIFERDSQTTMARLYGTVFALGGSVEDINQWSERLSEVTLDDVNAAARKYLQKNRSVTSFLRPNT